MTGLPQISVIVPVYNEAGNAARLAEEIAGVFAGQAFEMIFVDDASSDTTTQELLDWAKTCPTLRVIQHSHNAGQSRAVRTGALAARADILVTLDGDGQNDPADAPAFVQRLKDEPELSMVAGERRQRLDTTRKRVASRIANAARQALLQDGALDSGCGLKAFRRAVFLGLPYFDHMHRYLPALMLRDGRNIAFMPVGHRSRTQGISKYTNFQRLLDSLSDLFGVMWLRSRRRLEGPVQDLTASQRANSLGAAPPTANDSINRAVRTGNGDAPGAQKLS